LASTANGLQIGDLSVDLDGQQATGSGVVSFAAPVTATATLQLDRLDLDAYLPSEPAAPIAPTSGAATAATGAPKAAATTPATIVPPAPPLPDKTVSVFGLK